MTRMCGARQRRRTRKYTELRHDRRVRPFFFFTLQRNGKDVAVKPNTESSALLPAVVAARGRCYFPGFRLRGTHSKLSHTVGVAQMADLLQNALSIIFRVSCVFTERAHTVPGLSAPSGNQFFRFAAETHTNTRHEQHTHMCA